jgi:hypothetical protein
VLRRLHIERPMKGSLRSAHLSIGRMPFWMLDVHHP